MFAAGRVNIGKVLVQIRGLVCQRCTNSEGCIGGHVNFSSFWSLKGKEVNHNDFLYKKTIEKYCVVAEHARRSTISGCNSFEIRLKIYIFIFFTIWLHFRRFLYQKDDQQRRNTASVTRLQVMEEEAADATYAAGFHCHFSSAF